jgi:hypothetical protein
MTISARGEWGRRVVTPRDIVDVDTDAGLVAALAAADGRSVVVHGGDLRRTVGAASADASGHALELPVDLIKVTTDFGERRACAHVVARNRLRRGRWWRGKVVVVMNAQFLGGRHIAPRGHPNDGRLELQECDAALPLRARLAAQGRLRDGAHVPHPMIATRSVRAATWKFEHPMEVLIDGQRAGVSRTLGVAVEPDAAVIYI